jgi:site-specific DNA recombinase
MKSYGLVRVSTLGQKDNTSLSFQSKRIKDYCHLFEMELKDIITETESGGKDVDERSGLMKLKTLIENNECDTIIVNKIDRLGRSLLNGLLFLKYCEEHAIRVVSISESIDTDNPQSKLIINILWSIAEHEKDMIKSRLEDGRVKTFNDGNKPYGKTPYGYGKNHKGELVANK